MSAILQRQLRVAALLAIVAVLLPAVVRGQVIGPNFLLPACGGNGNEPSLAVQGSHRLAVWRCGYGTVAAAASHDGGVTWQDVSRIPWADYVSGPVASCTGDSGRFYVVGHVLDLTAQAHTIQVFEGRFVGPTFEWRRLANPVPLPYDACAHPASMAIEFDLVSRGLYLAFTKQRPGAGGVCEYHITFVRSTDLGQTWEPQQELTGQESAGAKLVVGPAGELTVAWENYVAGKIMGRRSEDFGASFGPEFELVPLRDNVALDPGSWSAEYSRRHPLMPSPNSSVCMQAPAAYAVAVDRSTGPRRGTWYLVTTEHATGTVGPRTGSASEVEYNNTYAAANPVEIGFDVNGSVVFSEDTYDIDQYWFTGEAGQTIWMNGLFFPSNVSFGPLISCGDDLARIGWVSCFNMLYNGSGPSAIYTLPSTGRYYLSMYPPVLNGAGYRVWMRSFTVDPGSVARDHRDILMCSSIDGGVTWSAKVRVSDGPVGSEEVFPEVAVDDEGRVHVAWYDRRDAVECGAETNTYWSWSDDGGATFAPAVRVSEEGSQSGNVEDERWAVGDHLGLAADNGKVYVVWTRIPIGGGADIWSSVITDVPTPVLISGLRAEERGGRTELRWWASDAREIAEFRVHRAAGASAYEVVGTVAPGLDREYRWRDESMRPGIRYRYRLEAVRHEGGSVWDGPVELLVPLPAIRLAWRGAVPNPFDDMVELELETPNRGGTRVTVYDVTGHEVAQLDAKPSGERTVVRWNGRDGRGRLVSPGVYLVRAQFGANTVVRQVVRMK